MLSPARDSRVRSYALLFVVALFYFVSYRFVLSQWWLWDDPQILFASMNSFRSLFLDPHSWRTLSSSSFVPIVVADYRIDRWIFGLEPLGYYAHMLLVGWLAVWAFYLLIRAAGSEIAAGIATVALTLAPASQRVFVLLMNRHYSEGLLFAALSLLCFHYAERRPLLYVAAGFFYLVAALEKEVFGPLPLFALLIAWHSADRRGALRRTMIAAGSAAMIYLGWRVWMLGSVGGYGPSHGTTHEIAKIDHTARMMLAFDSLWAPALLLTCGVLQIIAANRRRGALAAAAVILTAVMLPLAGVQEVADDRYLFAATAAVIGASAVACAASRSLASWAGFLIITISIASGGVVHRRSVADEHERMATEGRFVWQGNQRHPAFLESNLWYIDGIRWLRLARRSEAAPGGFGSFHAMVLSGVDPRQIVVNWNGRFVRANPRWLEPYQRVRNSFVPDRSLAIEIQRTESSLQWTIQSPGASEFMLLSGTTYAATSLGSPSGWMRLPNAIWPPTAAVMPDAQWFIVVASDGHSWTASPRFHFPKPGEVVRWQRSADGR